MEPLGPDVEFGDEVKEIFSDIMIAGAEASIPYDPMNRVSLVRRDGDTIGYTSLDVMDSGLVIGDEGTIFPLTPTNLITANTVLLDFLERIMPDESFFIYFVIEADRIIGSIDLSDFSKMPFRLCLLALALDLEEQILELTKNDAKNAWNALASKRKEIAKSLYTKKTGRIPTESSIPELLENTSFSDKCNILRKCVSLGSFETLLDTTIEFRNLLAHPTSEYDFFNLLRSIDLRKYTAYLRQMNHELRRLNYTFEKSNKIRLELYKISLKPHIDISDFKISNPKN